MWLVTAKKKPTEEPTNKGNSCFNTDLGSFNFISRSRKAVSQFINQNIINFRLLFESEIALFLNEVWARSAFSEEVARNPHYLLHLRC